LIRIRAAFVGGLVFGRAGVDLTADIFNFEGQIAGAAMFGAFENHVFHEVGEAGGEIEFIAATGGDMDGEGGAFRLGHSRDRDSRARRNLAPIVLCLTHD
jgi:hypothetical protein